MHLDEIVRRLEGKDARLTPELAEEVVKILRDSPPGAISSLDPISITHLTDAAERIADKKVLQKTWSRDELHDLYSLNETAIDKLKSGDYPKRHKDIYILLACAHAYKRNSNFARMIADFFEGRNRITFLKMGYDNLGKAIDALANLPYLVADYRNERAVWRRFRGDAAWRIADEMRNRRLRQDWVENAHRQYRRGAQVLQKGLRSQDVDKDFLAQLKLQESNAAHRRADVTDRDDEKVEWLKKAYHSKALHLKYVDISSEDKRTEFLFKWLDMHKLLRDISALLGGTEWLQGMYRVNGNNSEWFEEKRALEKAAHNYSHRADVARHIAERVETDEDKVSWLQKAYSDYERSMELFSGFLGEYERLNDVIAYTFCFQQLRSRSLEQLRQDPQEMIRNYRSAELMFRKLETVELSDKARKKLAYRMTFQADSAKRISQTVQDKDDKLTWLIRAHEDNMQGARAVLPWDENHAAITLINAAFNAYAAHENNGDMTTLDMAYNAFQEARQWFEDHADCKGYRSYLRIKREVGE